MRRSRSVWRNQSRTAGKTEWSVRDSDSSVTGNSDFNLSLQMFICLPVHAVCFLCKMSFQVPALINLHRHASLHSPLRAWPDDTHTSSSSAPAGGADERDLQLDVVEGLLCVTLLVSAETQNTHTHARRRSNNCVFRRWSLGESVQILIV